MVEGTDLRIYFARHGESEANVLRVFSNRSQQHPLTNTGRGQAAALGERLLRADIRQIFAIPLPRARESAEIIGSLLGIHVVLSDSLREWDVGELEGRNDQAAWAQYWDVRRRWVYRPTRREGPWW